MSDEIRPEVREQMREIANRIADHLPAGFGFALLVFELHKTGFINYISNANRPDMLRALKEFIANAEKDQ